MQEKLRRQSSRLILCILIASQSSIVSVRACSAPRQHVSFSAVILVYDRNIPSNDKNPQTITIGPISDFSLVPSGDSEIFPGGGVGRRPVP
jgi:hypothetical protein